MIDFVAGYLNTVGTDCCDWFNKAWNGRQLGRRRVGGASRKKEELRGMNLGVSETLVRHGESWMYRMEER